MVIMAVPECLRLETSGRNDTLITVVLDLKENAMTESFQMVKKVYWQISKEHGEVRKETRKRTPEAQPHVLKVLLLQYLYVLFLRPYVVHPILDIDLLESTMWPIVACIFQIFRREIGHGVVSLRTWSFAAERCM